MAENTDMIIKEEDTFILPEHVVLREEDNGAFLFNTITNALKAVNETGRDIIQSLLKGSAFHAMIDQLMDTFEDVARIRVEDDAKKFIAQLTDQGYIIKK